MDIVIYARYSSHNQSECSIEGQIEVCEAYAKQHNYNIVGKYIDRATTGTNDNRPEFRQMLKDSEKKLFKAVLVYQLDRFARNRYDSAINKSILKKNDVRVLSAKENISDDASGILMESVLEGMAEYFSVELGQKVQRGMNLNAECGYYNGGSVPLGFKLEEIIDERFSNQLKKKVKKKLVIDEITAPIVQTIFEMYANGSKMKNIIDYLNGLGLKTSYGNSFNKSSIRRILENKKYIGVYTYKENEKRDCIPRIVSDELFERVHQELIRNGLAPSRSRAKTEYLLTGKLYCGKCNEKMTGKSGTSKTKKLHTYYACKGSTATNKTCSKKQVKQKVIEDLVIKCALELLTNDNINLIANKVIEATNKEDTTKLKLIHKAIKDNERKQRNVLNAISDCEDENNRKILFNELTKLSAESEENKKALLSEENKLHLLNITDVKFFLRQLKKGNIDDLKYRKLLINTLIHKVYLFTDRAVLLYNVSGKEQEIEISLINNIVGSPIDEVALPLV